MTSNNIILTQNRERRHGWLRTLGWVLLVTAMFAIAFLLNVGVAEAVESETAALLRAELNPSELYALVESGHGGRALDLLAADAAARGGWGPAPGDVAVYDPYMARTVRGAVQVADSLPMECTSARLSQQVSDCQLAFSEGNESLVRFGYALFADPGANGNWTVRTNGDDMLSVYIEETGHSWQEYFYETEGRGSGVRTRTTSWEAAQARSRGWEYQVKAYVLSLDGLLLRLSAAERRDLLVSICDPSGYANPLGQTVEPHGPPPGWPNPQGWPRSSPAVDVLAAFCARG